MNQIQPYGYNLRTLGERPLIKATRTILVALGLMARYREISKIFIRGTCKTCDPPTMVGSNLTQGLQFGHSW